ncbi:RDD family protein [Prosthecobacter vanneervenii]|uniref:Putative RDD family membrane protein YckC n=1 Tax=Prosthecobacter vanneervenii TaxID=48466 RepID=A0A7W7YA37_9BACT|nr:RDD family protein [Prosthecobacter vanneervenii]MBB5032304.1 putative RDD family membrane protein YckC [Prosthecobacter vanneervenii]
MSQYHIARNGQQLGVYAEQDVQSGLASGSILPTDLLWAEGMADWQPVGGRFGSSAQVTASQPAFNPYAAPQSNVISSAMSPVRELASLGQRLGAALLDFLVGGVVVGVPYAIAMASMGMAEGSHQEGLTTGAKIGFAVAGIGFLALIIYNLVLLSTKGQTIGKKWLGIRIVTHPDCQKAGFVKAVLLRGFVNGIIGAIPLLGALYSLIDICCIFRADRRCIHDMIAGTQVIKC